jgi:hypothetical protein
MEQASDPQDAVLNDRRKTMKTLILAAAVTVALGVGAAFAGEGDGTSVTTLFTSIPGQQPSLTVPGRVTGPNKNADAAHAYVTNSNRGTWLFPPAQGGSGG